jgi:hypothetical protein
MLEELKNQGWETINKEEYDRADANYEYKTIITLANPELFDILEYTRKCGIVPNITINGSMMTDDLCERLARVLGAIAVSRYDKDTCYNAIFSLNSWKEKLGNEATLKQVNIHQILCSESLPQCYQVIDDWQTDERLKDLNAIVFLLMKPKGKRNKYHQLTSMEEYKKFIDYAFDKKAPIGFDSCSAFSFLKAVKDREDYSKLEMLAEPCESDCFSSYINVDSKFFHCSFTEGEDGWEGIDVLNCNDFMEDVWNSSEVCKFRGLLMKSVEKHGCRSCPIFDLNME